MRRLTGRGARDLVHMVFFPSSLGVHPGRARACGSEVPGGAYRAAANCKTLRAIHEEIRAAQGKPMSGTEVKQVRILTLLPSFVRQVCLMYISMNPHLRKQYMGTVGLTAVGMFGNRGGWGLDVPFPR